MNFFINFVLLILVITFYFKDMKNYFENFDAESRKIEFNVKPEMTINDLSKSEKEEIFGKNIFEVEFTISDAFEMTR